MMTLRLLTAALSLCLPAVASAQASEDFEAGNPDNWHMDFDGTINGGAIMSRPGTHQPAGGNPGGMLEFLSLQGAFEYWALQPDPGNADWTGSFAARGIGEVAFDVNHVQGVSPFGMHFYVLFADDMGTTELFDDILIYSQFDPGTYSFAGVGGNAIPQGVWTRVAWSFDATSSTLPMGWSVFSYGGTNSGNDDNDWQAVMADVDYMAIINSNPGGGFALGTLDIQFDNITLASDGPGTSYCMATTNSAGTQASIRATGSNVVATQNLTLVNTGGVPGVPGLFFFGTTQVQLPFGDGFRCAGGATRRIQPAANADGAGMTQRSLNFGAPYAAAIVPAADLSFQFWYRDSMAGMAGFNLSNGLNIVFQ